MAFKVARRGSIAPFMVMDVLRAANQRAAQGADIVHLELGQPGGLAPAAVRAAAQAAIDSHGLGYTEAFGLPDLRRHIADQYAQAHKVQVDPGQVAVTVGSSGAFLLAFLAAFDVGDRVAIAAPGYPAYRNILTALGVEVVEISVGPDSHWHLTPAHLTAVPGGLDGVIVASPGNPSGSMMSAGQVSALAAWCESAGVRLISDEIYHGISFGPQAVTVAGGSGHAIVINSFSKYYAMTGWRLGWMVVPPDLVRTVECLQQNLFISAPTLSQLAACHAFGCQDELDARVRGYAENRDILLNDLPALGFGHLAPSDGAFYLYADISDRTDDSGAFCRKMLDQIGVATTPGLDFDPGRGHCFVRFSFAGPRADMIKAVRRLKDWRG